MSDYSVGEGDGTLCVCASLEGESERDITVNVTTDDNTAFSEFINGTCIHTYICRELLLYVVY